MACDAEDCEFEMLNDDEIVASVQEVSDPVDDETDEDYDNKNESSKGLSNAYAFSVLEAGSYVLRNSEKANGSSLLPPLPSNRRHSKERAREEKGAAGHRVTCVISVKKLDNCLRLRLVNFPTFRLGVIFSPTREHYQRSYQLQCQRAFLKFSLDCWLRGDAFGG
ncbi:uncharacterized protein TNCV_3579361 [Trichonephila clavipes]|nr:uncharacterized protein TNCV_3579361 [Trichonephila clavipes]